jgi:hypothetical protein
VSNGSSLQRLDAAGKRAEVVRLRSLGWTWARIAETVGYSDGAHAARVFSQACKELPAPNLTELRQESAMRLEAMMDELSKIIADPPALHSANGVVVRDPDTGQVLADKSVVVRAVSELRKADESYRKLTGLDERRQVDRGEAMRRAKEWLADLEVQLAPPRRGWRGEIES